MDSCYAMYQAENGMAQAENYRNPRCWQSNAYACIFEFHNGRTDISLSLKARGFKKVNEIDEFEYQVICL